MPEKGLELERFKVGEVTIIVESEGFDIVTGEDSQVYGWPEGFECKEGLSFSVDLAKKVISWKPEENIFHLPVLLLMCGEAEGISTTEESYLGQLRRKVYSTGDDETAKNEWARITRETEFTKRNLAVGRYLSLIERFPAIEEACTREDLWNYLFEGLAANRRSISGIGMNTEEWNVPLTRLRGRLVPAN